MSGPRLAIVFGGSGFIGQHLIAALTAGGQQVISADLEPLATPIAGASWVACDVRRPILRSLAPADRAGELTVYNLAAIHRTPGHPDREYYDTNVSGALRVTEFCDAVNATSLVFTSSISVYGPDEAEKDETSALTPESAYGASKLQAEHIHQRWCEADARRRLVVVRPAVIFGAGERGNFTRLARALRQRRFVYPGRKDTIKACGYVGDLVDSIAFALALPTRSFLYNFCYPEPYTLEQICRAFSEVGALPAPLATLPYRPMRLVAAGFEQLARLGVPTEIRRERIDKLVRSTKIRPAALLAAGYRYPTDLAAGLAAWREQSAGRFQ